jgi:glycosyltransferase involved in cell wall biosynthesis
MATNVESGARGGRRELELLSGSGAPESSGLVSIVIPLRNERPSLRSLHAEIAVALEGRRWEIVFVDDGSSDGSYEELVQIHADATNVRVVRLRRNFGKSTALAVGFAAARGDAIVTLDADLQDDPAEIPRLMAKLDEGFDLVSGWKRDRQDTAARRAFSRVYNTVTAVVTGVRLHDMNCGLKAYRAEVVRNMAVYGDLHRFVPALAQQRGYRVAELSVNHRPRAYGVSRYGLERYMRGFFDLLTVAFMGRYRSRPLHLFGGMGMLLGLTGFVILVYLTGVKLAGHGIGQRPLLLLGALLVVVGVQLFSLGLVGELITSHHAERTSPADKVRDHVRDILE